MRLDRFLANNGFGTRKEVKELVKQNRVQVNKAFGVKYDMSIDPSRDVVAVDGEDIVYKEFYYILLNKPKGYISATEDFVQNTVLDLIPEFAFAKLFPVGRLDKDTTGLLILTNDGQLAHSLISPKKHVDKVYIATLDKPLDMKIQKEFESGIMMDGEKTLPAQLKKLGDNVAEVTIHQGKYHQVKRMFEHFSYHVEELDRKQLAFLTLDGLEVGEYRELTKEEVDELKSLSKR
jgi:16S rRNA pseudouridine516 synthase